MPVARVHRPASPARAAMPSAVTTFSPALVPGAVLGGAVVSLGLPGGRIASVLGDEPAPCPGALLLVEVEGGGVLASGGGAVGSSGLDLAVGGSSRGAGRSTIASVEPRATVCFFVAESNSDR